MTFCTDVTLSGSYSTISMLNGSAASNFAATSFTACEPRILIQWDDDWEGFTTLIEITPETADARQIENIIKELWLWQVKRTALESFY